MEPSELELEQMLRSHLSGELDVHRGQAARAFAREVTKPMQRRLSRDAIRRQFAHYRPAAQRWASIGLAMAACTAMGFYLPHLLSHPATAPVESVASVPPPKTGDNIKIITPEFAGFERTTVVRHVDEGSGLSPDGEFGRKIRQQRVETYRFTDPATHERYEWTVPTEENLILPLGHQ